MNVAMLSVLPTDEVVVRSLRSIDTGATFSPNGERIDADPAPISDAAGPGTAPGRPAIDSAYSTWSQTAPIWPLPP